MLPDLALVLANLLLPVETSGAGYLVRGQVSGLLERFHYVDGALGGQFLSVFVGVFGQLGGEGSELGGGSS